MGRRVGNYELKQLIGEGASSKIFLAEHLMIGSRVAVKALRPPLHRHPDLVRRFVGEARATNLVRHDNIVQIYDIGLFDDWQYHFVMEYLRGTTLTPKIAEGAMALERAAPILLQICDALNAAHAHGVVHRDLKPDNIYVVPSRDREQVKIVDFGIARRETLEGGEQRTTAGTVLGTALYMSPEQASGGDVDGRADIYALGVIMFELATGQFPFDASNVGVLMLSHATRPPPMPRSINAAVSPAYEDVILRCLAKSPSDRFPTMADLGRAIVQAQKNPRTPTPPPVASPVQANHAVRYAASVEVRLQTDEGVLPGSCVATDISTGGVFISIPAGTRMPPVFSHVVVSAQGLGESGSLAGEVVRVEAPIDAEIGARRGIGIRFDSGSGGKSGIGDLLGRVVPVPREEPGDPEVARLLAHFESRPKDDHYALLGVSPYIDAGAAREAITRLALELDPRRFPKISAPQRTRLSALHARLAEAEETLVHSGMRVAYDASRGNFVGVARCISAGLPVADLRKCREVFIAAHPQATAASFPHVAHAEELMGRGELKEALASLAKALEHDPLNDLLQRRFWDLRRRAAKGAP